MDAIDISFSLVQTGAIYIRFTFMNLVNRLRNELGCVMGSYGPGL